MIFSLKLSPLKFFRILVGHCLIVFTFLITILYLFTPSEVRSQGQENINAILDRMGRLENDIRNLNISISRGLPAPEPNSTTSLKSSKAALPKDKIGSLSSHAVARLSVQISALENDLRSVTGAMEKFNFQVGNLTNRMDKLVADIDYRLGLLEGRVPGSETSLSGLPKTSAAPIPPSVQKIIPGESPSFASKPGVLGTVSQSSVDALAPENSKERSSGAASSKIVLPSDSSLNKPSSVVSNIPSGSDVAIIKKSILPKGTAKQQYEFAFGLLRKANYDKAEKALQEFVKNNPNDKLAVNARYWLGETFYVRAAYVQAAEVFLEGYQADPKGKKAADSLIKLGMSLSGLDKKREACSAFEKVIKDFSNISKGMRKTISREKKKNSCRK